MIKVDSDSNYSYELGYSRSPVSAGSKFQISSKKIVRVTSRIPVTASSKSKCESTVITGYGSTQDDEHLCRKREQSLCYAGYKCSKRAQLHTDILI